MGCCACLPEADSKLSYIRYIQLSKKQAISVSSGGGRTQKQPILAIDSTSDCNWKTLLKEILNDGDDETYKWKPTMLNAIKNLKGVDNPRYRSNLFWDLYSSSLNEQIDEHSPSKPRGPNINDDRLDTYKKLVKKISHQLEDPNHPFRFLQAQFDSYVALMYSNSKMFEYTIMNRLTKDITDVVNVMSYATIYFYNLALKLVPRNAELFLGVMTDLFIRDTAQKIIVGILKDEVSTQTAIFKAKIEKFRKIRLDQLKVSPYLAFDPNFRNTHKMKPGRLLHNNTRPLEKAIEELVKIKALDQPNKKLEQLYRFSKVLVTEVDEFWEGFVIKREHLIMDPDSLLSLYIFCIIKGEYQEVLVDHKFMEIFITDVDRKSAKGYHLVTLGIAFEWILNQNDDNFSSRDINLKHSIRIAGNTGLRASIFAQNNAGNLLSRFASKDTKNHKEDTMIQEVEEVPIPSNLYRNKSMNQATSKHKANDSIANGLLNPE